MRYKGRLLVGALTGLAAACMSDPREDEEEADAELEVELRADDAVAAACPNTRIIGRRAAQANACPDPNEDPDQPLWTVTNLLHAGTDFLVANPAALANPLRRYCSYEWIGQGVPNAQRRAVQTPRGAVAGLQSGFPTSVVGLGESSRRR